MLNEGRCQAVPDKAAGNPVKNEKRKDEIKSDKLPRAGFSYVGKNFFRPILVHFIYLLSPGTFRIFERVADVDRNHIYHHNKSHIVDSRWLFHEKKRMDPPSNELRWTRSRL